MISVNPVSSDHQLNELTRVALTSKDGLAVGELVKTIAAFEGDPNVRAAVLVQIAERDPFASHIVVGVLSGLALHNLPNAREFARKIISEPFNPEKDLILARAYSILIELPPIAAEDVPRILKGVSHPVNCIRGACDRALKFISRQSAAFLREEVQKFPQSGIVNDLVQRLDSLLLLHPARLPSHEFGNPDEDAPSKRRQPKVSPSKPKIVARQKVARPSGGGASPKKNVGSEVRERPPVQSLPPAASETLGNSCLPSRSTTPPPLELPERLNLPTAQLNQLCESTEDPTRFIVALAELCNRLGVDAALVHTNRFLYFACQPDYPRELFQRVSEHLFRR